MPGAAHHRGAFDGGHDRLDVPAVSGAVVDDEDLGGSAVLASQCLEAGGELPWTGARGHDDADRVGGGHVPISPATITMPAPPKVAAI